MPESMHVAAVQIYMEAGNKQVSLLYFYSSFYILLIHVSEDVLMTNLISADWVTVIAIRDWLCIFFFPFLKRGNHKSGIWSDEEERLFDCKLWRRNQRGFKNNVMI